MLSLSSVSLPPPLQAGRQAVVQRMWDRWWVSARRVRGPPLVGLTRVAQTRETIQWAQNSAAIGPDRRARPEAVPAVPTDNSCARTVDAD